jgi:hypothetical protein
MQKQLSDAMGNGTTQGFWLSGSYQVIYYGVFGGATAKLQVSVDNLNWVDLPNSSSTTATTFGVDIGDGFQVRLVIAGGGGTTQISCYFGMLRMPVQNVA